MTQLIGPCWPWPVPGRARDGRPQVRGRDYVYRLVYEAATGVKLAPLDVLHHRCENTLCVNPWHMELTSQSEHMKAHGQGGDWGQAAKTHCPAGHAYDEANTYIHHRSNGSVERNCRACAAQRSRQARRRS